MKALYDVSVDDAVSVGFSYHSEAYIHIVFDGCFDVKSGKPIEKLCTLIIKQWSSASVKEDDNRETRWRSLDEKLGIVSMIFSIQLVDNLLEVYVLTLDNRYLMLRFENAIAGYIFPDDL